ncbi:DUF2785 domain-containing protein [Dolichospermum sp. ST_sed1]|nr:DUF2785 domain-containing protein [Dolichospermum sp. ST_sed1]
MEHWDSFLKFREFLLQNTLHIQPESDICELLSDSFSFLDNSDYKIRDKQVYTTLANYFESENLTPYIRQWALDLLSGETYLLDKILNTEDLPVACKRSFSVLLIGNIITGDAKYDRQFGVLALHNLCQLIIQYLNLEKVTLGYHEKYGWIHAIAHTADALNSIAQHPSSIMMTHRLIVSEILKFVDLFGQKSLFQNDEGGRLALAFSNAIVKLEQIDEIQNFWTKDYVFGEPFSQRENTRNFLRAVYYVLNKQKIGTDGVMKWLEAIFD